MGERHGCTCDLRDARWDPITLRCRACGGWSWDPRQREAVERRKAGPPCDHGGPGKPLVTCDECGRDKAPFGRDVAAACAGAYCGDECPGYLRRPRPSSLWPGEDPDPDLCRICRCNDCLAADAPHQITVRGQPRWLCARCWRVREAGTRHLVILSGEPFDWEEGKRIAERVVDEDGGVNWGAAARADPGVVRCPACGVYHWREGERVRCSMTDCAHEWRLRG